MTTNERPTHIMHECTGPNKKCKAAAKEGRRVHIIPMSDRTQPTLILPDYHFYTEDGAYINFRVALETAPIVTCDEDLYRFRAEGTAHKLPVGWIDPTRR